MKAVRFLVLLALVMGMLAGPWQAPANAEMLGRPGQIKNLSYNNTEGKWYELKPDGTSSAFIMHEGQSFIMTVIHARFMSATPPPKPGPIVFTSWGPTQAGCTSLT